MIGSAIGAGLKVAGSIFGGISASKAMKQVRGNLNQQIKENQDWYDRRYNEDATQRADAQRMITMVNDSIRNRNRQAAGTQAVMGGTDESVAVAKEDNNKALADVTSRIVSQADARKDQIEQQYLSKKEGINDQLNNLQMQKAHGITQAIQGVAGAASEIAPSLDEAFGKSKS